VKRLTCSDSLQLKVTAHLIFLFCQRGELQCTAGNESHDLASEDCAAIDGDVPLINLRAAEPAEVLVIEMFQEEPTA
jgi:hypothetical protein